MAASCKRLNLIQLMHLLQSQTAGIVNCSQKTARKKTVDLRNVYLAILPFKKPEQFSHTYPV